MQSKQKHNETNDDEIDSAACSIFQRRACVCVCVCLCVPVPLLHVQNKNS